MDLFDAAAGEADRHDMAVGALRHRRSGQAGQRDCGDAAEELGADIWHGYLREVEDRLRDQFRWALAGVEGAQRRTALRSY